MPIASAAESKEEAEREVLRRFASFDAMHAQCFVEAERQRLLAGLETGFGSLQQFNNLVAGIFSQTSERGSRARTGSIRLWEHEPPPKAGGLSRPVQV